VKLWKVTQQFESTIEQMVKAVLDDSYTFAFKKDNMICLMGIFLHFPKERLEFMRILFNEFKFDKKEIEQLLNKEIENNEY